MGEPAVGEAAPRISIVGAAAVRRDRSASATGVAPAVARAIPFLRSPIPPQRSELLPFTAIVETLAARSCARRRRGRWDRARRSSATPKADRGPRRARSRSSSRACGNRVAGAAGPGTVGLANGGVDARDPVVGSCPGPPRARMAKEAMLWLMATGIPNKAGRRRGAPRPVRLDVPRRRVASVTRLSQIM